VRVVQAAQLEARLVRVRGIAFGHGGAEHARGAVGAAQEATVGQASKLALASQRGRQHLRQARAVLPVRGLVDPAGTPLRPTWSARA
jgi:hypothetical protein